MGQFSPGNSLASFSAHGPRFPKANTTPYSFSPGNSLVHFSKAHSCTTVMMDNARGLWAGCVGTYALARPTLTDWASACPVTLPCPPVACT